MPKRSRPRHGSMQFWPRKRARRHYARIRSWTNKAELKPLGFAGYKVGMTQVIFTDNGANSMTKGQDITCPVTIIECPALKIAGVSFYKNSIYGSKKVSCVLSPKLDKELARKITLPKKETKKIEDIANYDDLTLLVHTQPKLTAIGRKKPELFEIALGGKKEDKINFAKENLGKDLTISQVFKEGELVDIHSITKGKGYQGPVKRFGVKIRRHKSEKTKRGPGSLGAWCGQAHIMYRVAHAGQMGYQQRIEHNKQIFKISNKAEEINPKGGFIKYGNVKSDYLLVKGSVAGSRNRIIRFNAAIRPNHKIKAEAPAIQQIYA